MNNVISNFDVIRQTMLRRNIYNYDVFMPDGKTQLFFYSGESVSDVQNAISELEEFIQNCTGLVKIVLRVMSAKSPDQLDKRNSMTFIYNCGGTMQGNGQLNRPVNGMAQMPLYEGMPSIFQLLNENMDLKIKLALIEKGENGGNKVIMQSRILTSIEKLLGVENNADAKETNMNGNKAVNGEQKAASSTDETDRFKNAIIDLKADNPDLIKQLEMLAKLKKNNPELFNTMVNQLSSL